MAKGSIDGNRLAEVALRRLPEGARADVLIRPAGLKAWELLARCEPGVPHDLPTSARLAREVADDFEADGVHLAFDATPTLGPGFHWRFEWVS